ncbi:thioredoxin family protein [Aureimonas phyllosphaerae]|uniref:thioredoxin family protein n=1 Tax=Aureimonas phyllosphaerae TaxID=1166078 RepID=UPI003A5BCAFF
MPKTESNTVALGTKAPDFSLPGPGVHEVALSDFADSPALLVAFISNRCPFVVLLREELAAFARDYADRGLAVIAINSNDATAHPEETLERIEAEVREQGYGFPYLKDASQEVAKAYDAACTPDFFLFDAERRLAYHGQFDDARPGNGKPVTGADLRAAVDAVLAGQAPDAAQTPSIGCNIKWTEGNAPAAVSAAA